MLQDPLEVVSSCLADHHAAVRDALLKGWRRWCDTPVFPVIGPREKTARANVVNVYHNHIFAPYAENHPDIRVHRRDNTTYYVVRDQVAFKFKLGDEHGRSNNLNTRQGKPYRYHDPTPGDLFGHLFRVEAIYVLDKPEQKIVRTYIVYRVGSHIEWGYELPSTSTHKLEAPESVQEFRGGWTRKDTGRVTQEEGNEL